MIACHTREFYWKSQDTFNCYDKMLKMGGNALSYRHCDSYASNHEKPRRKELESHSSNREGGRRNQHKNQLPKSLKPKASNPLNKKAQTTLLEALDKSSLRRNPSFGHMKGMNILIDHDDRIQNLPAQNKTILLFGI